MTVHYSQFDSPIGRLILTANEHAVTGLYFSTGAKARSEPDPQWRLTANSLRRTAFL